MLAALGKNLDEIVFLEHLERGVIYFESTWLSNDDFRYYHEEGIQLKEKYRGKIKVGIGVEVGYNPQQCHELKDFLQQYAWDRVGISYHFLKINDRFVNMVSRKKSNLDLMEEIGLDAIIEQYYRGLHAAVELLDGTMVCHLDAVSRHHPLINQCNERPDLIQQLLDAIAAKKMAIEVNTSGFAIRDEPFPGRRWLREAMARNIPLVAGSDAHRPDDVGRYFDRLKDYRV